VQHWQSSTIVLQRPHAFSPAAAENVTETVIPQYGKVAAEHCTAVAATKAGSQTDMQTVTTVHCL